MSHGLSLLETHIASLIGDKLSGEATHLVARELPSLLIYDVVPIILHIIPIMHF
jgi:hypothetical protein